MMKIFQDFTMCAYTFGTYFSFINSQITNVDLTCLTYLVKWHGLNALSYNSVNKLFLLHFLFLFILQLFIYPLHAQHHSRIHTHLWGLSLHGPAWASILKILSICNGFLVLKLVKVQKFSQIENGSIFSFLAPRELLLWKSAIETIFYKFPALELVLLL